MTRCDFPAAVAEASSDHGLSFVEENGQRRNMTLSRAWSQTAIRIESPRRFLTSSPLVSLTKEIPEERRCAGTYGLGAVRIGDVYR